MLDEDYQGEIKLLMHNMTRANYKVLEENPVAQMVVYQMDKLPVIHADGDFVPFRINLQVKRGDKGFGEATKFFQAQLTDDLSDIGIPCSGVWVHELWQTPAKHQEDNRSSHLVQSTVSVTTELPVATPLALQKKKPEIAPKPIMGIAMIRRGNKVCCSPQSTKSVTSATKVLFKNTQDSSTDSDDMFIYESLDTSPLCDNSNVDGGLVSWVSITHNTEKQNKIPDAENMYRVTHSVFKQTQGLHNN